MKKLLVGVAAMATVIVPSIATAGTAANSLSVKAAAVQPVRAAAQPGETKAIGTVPIVIAALLVAGGLIWLIADGSSN